MKMAFEFKTPDRGYGWLFTTCLNFHYWKPVGIQGSVIGITISFFGYGIMFELENQIKKNQGAV